MTKKYPSNAERQKAYRHRMALDRRNVTAEVEAAKRTLIEAEEKAAREAAKAEGFAEWKKTSSGWCISIADHVSGDVVSVRTRSGEITQHTLGDSVGAGIYKSAGEYAIAA